MTAGPVPATPKAIPTTYADTEFRSRLEARTAMLLDQHSIEWHYEAEGFELSDGTRYLPDFWLPRTRTYVEVKGQNVPGVEKARRFARDLAGDTYELTDTDHPIVLIATLERREHHDRLALVNALGASVFHIRCPVCRQRQWVNIGVWTCRACAHDLTAEAYEPSSTPRNAAHPGELPRLPQWTPAR